MTFTTETSVMTDVMALTKLTAVKALAVEKAAARARLNFMVSLLD